MSPLGAKVNTMGCLSPLSNCVCANPAAMFTVVVADAATENGVEDSVPLTDTLLVSTEPADDDTNVATVPVHVCPAPRSVASHVICSPATEHEPVVEDTVGDPMPPVSTGGTRGSLQEAPEPVL